MVDFHTNSEVKAQYLHGHKCLNLGFIYNSYILLAYVTNLVFYSVWFNLTSGV